MKPTSDFKPISALTLDWNLASDDSSNSSRLSNSKANLNKSSPKIVKQVLLPTRKLHSA